MTIASTNAALRFRLSAIPAPRHATAWKSRDGRFPAWAKPNVPESFSVWGVDVANPQTPQVISRLKTGLLVGARRTTVRPWAAAPPNFLAAQGDALFVSNGNNDMIERIDLARNEIVAKQRIVPSPLVARVRGVSPAGMVVSPDGNRLYVAEMGINAIAVLDTKTLAVRGHIPTAWYPYRVALSPDGRQLVCIGFRGFGNGPNARQEIPQSEFLDMRGVVSILDVPSDDELPTMTADVLAYNGMVDRSGRPRNNVVAPHSRRAGEHFAGDQVRRLHHQGESHLRYDLRPHSRREARPPLVALGLAPDDSGARAAHAARCGRDGQSQRPGPAVHGGRQLLHGAGGFRRGPPLAGGRAAE